MEMLLDVLVHSEGLRIRDHISHGEVDLCEISQQSANHILCICIAFAGLYIDSDKGSLYLSDAFPVMTRICETAKVYKSVFHPISLLVGAVRNLASSFLKWKDLPKPSDEEFDSLENTGNKCTGNFPDVERAIQALITATLAFPGDNLITKFLPCQFDLGQIDTFVQTCAQFLDTASCPTLFRPKGKLEIALLLSSIVQHGKVISEQARKTFFLFLYYLK